MPTSDDDLLSAAAVAAIFGVKPATIRSWASRGDPRLPRAIRFGANFTRWRRGDVLARLDALATGELLLMPRRR